MKFWSCFIYYSGRQTGAMVMVKIPHVEHRSRQRLGNLWFTIKTAGYFVQILKHLSWIWFCSVYSLMHGWKKNIGLLNLHLAWNWEGLQICLYRKIRVQNYHEKMVWRNQTIIWWGQMPDSAWIVYLGVVVYVG